MKRYLALDALRGLTIALMILVNTPGSWSHVYPPLLHADWHGWTPTDLVFPFFLFIVGSAMYFSFSKVTSGLTSELTTKVVKRGAIMFVIGILLNAFPFVAPLDELRIMGVMQRIGIAYVLAALIALSFQRTGVLVISAIILVFYWLLLMSVGEQAYSLDGNLVTFVDTNILTSAHMWQGKGIAFDPEGLLSSLPAVVNVLLGFEATRLLSTSTDHQQAIKRLLIAGVVGVVIGQLFSLLMPINKSLWTSSFVILTSAIACLVLAGCILLIDVWQVNKPIQPLVAYGSNPLFIYVLSWVWVDSYHYISIGDSNLYQYLFESLAQVMPEKLASFIFAFGHVVLFWLVAQYLFKRKIFIKI